MSYTPPLGSAVDFTLSGGYAPPGGSAVNLNLSGTAYSASGFKSTALPTPSLLLRVSGLSAGAQFGTPAISRAWIKQATGFTSTQFGVPVCPYAQIVSASGVTTTTTQFGVPYAPHTVTGFTNLAQFGEPSYRQFNAASGIAPTTVVPSPYRVFNQTLNPSGWLTGRFGDVSGMLISGFPTNTYTKPTPIRSTRFGVASKTTTVTQQATGQSTTQHGAPTLGQAYSAQSFSASDLGTPATALGAHAQGFRSAALGLPTQQRAQRVTALYRAPRWGEPAAERSNTFKVYSIQPLARLAQPRGMQRFGRQATGFCTTQLGTHGALKIYRARSIPPPTRLGKPIMKRNVLC